MTHIAVRLGRKESSTITFRGECEHRDYGKCPACAFMYKSRFALHKLTGESVVGTIDE